MLRRIPVGHHGQGDGEAGAGNSGTVFASLFAPMLAMALGWQAAVTTLSALRSIVHALRGWPTPLGAALNSTEVSFDDHGVPSDPAVERTLRTIGQQVVQFAQEHCAGAKPGWP